MGQRQRCQLGLGLPLQGQYQERAALRRCNCEDDKQPERKGDLGDDGASYWR